MERKFEIVELSNDRSGYVQTLRAWRNNLRARREEALAASSPEIVKRFNLFLRLSEVMFESGTCDLLRFTLKRIDHPRPRRANAHS